MPDIRIPALPAATRPTGGELFENVQGGVSKKATIEQVWAGPQDAAATVYVAANGSDLNSGRTPFRPRLTLASALTLAGTLSPAVGNVVAVKVIGGGTYTENISIPAYVRLDAPEITYVGAMILGDGSVAVVGSHYPAVGSSTMVTRTGGGTGYYEARISDGRGLAGNLTTVTNLSNATNGAILFAKVDKLIVNQFGKGVQDFAASLGHIHFTIKDLYFGANTSIGLDAGSNSNLIGYIDHILKLGSPTGTKAIVVANGGEVQLTAGAISADVAWELTGTGQLFLQCPRIDGTQTGSATFGYATPTALAAASNAAAPRDGAIMLSANNASGTTIAIGTSDFVLTLPALALDDWSVSDTDAANLLWESATTGNNRVRVGLRANGVWRITFTDTSGTETTYDITPTVAFTDASAATVNLAFDRDGNATLWRNGVANGSVSIAAASAIDLGSGNANPYRFFGGTAISGILREAILHNLLLTNIADRYVSGVWVPSAEQWGFGKSSNTFTTSILTAFEDFTAQTNGFDANNITASGLAWTTLGQFIPTGKQVRVTGNLTFVSGTSLILRLGVGITSIGGIGEAPASGEIAIPAGDFDLTLTATAEAGMVQIFTRDAGTSVEVRNVNIQVLGCTAYLTPQGLGRQLIDVSANRNHALCTTEPSYTVPKLSAVIRSEAQSLTNGTTILATDILPTDSPVTGVTIGNATLPMLATAQALTTRTLTIGRDGSNNVVVNRNGVAITGPLASAPATADVEIRYMKA